MSSQTQTARLSLPQISHDVWKEKYRWRDEQTSEESMERVCYGVYANDPAHLTAALEAMRRREWCPGGRIHAGAGTDKSVTWINCYVSRPIEDSLEGIMAALRDGALTQQMGGGIGYDFSTLRPRGAIVRRTQSVSSGVIPFMKMFDAMCQTIQSSGARRGAQMGTLRVDHPDILEFIEAKNEPGVLTNFNISALVTTDFMNRINANNLPYAMWELRHNIPNSKNDSRIYYSGWAPNLWDKILRHTYEYSEPGVLFIDRINELNNLSYCETISTTNPCGEQPLPPFGCCNLGAVNLSALVDEPFTEAARLNWRRLREVVRIGVRFLDNVLDTTKYPLPEQEAEAKAKRRIGLGITGLATALQMLGMRYGSKDAIDYTESIMQEIATEAYYASVDLAKERGAFPAFDKDKFLKSAFLQKLPYMLRKQVEVFGIRNGVLLTVAPTGTTSLYYGNISSGLEPVFAYEYNRKVRQEDGSSKTYAVRDYGFSLTNGQILPHFVTANELTVDEHLEMQAAVQKWVDASVSKTINCPENISYDDFKHVYERAYELGLKGCTTYRPSNVRGSVLSLADPSCPSGVCTI